MKRARQSLWSPRSFTAGLRAARAARALALLALLGGEALAGAPGARPLADGKASTKGGPAEALRGGRLPLAEALAQARAQGRTLVLEFSTSWCEACLVLEREVLPDARVQAALRGVLFARYDAEAAQGLPAARSLKVIGYPTLVALAKDGSEISRIQGVPDTADLARWIERAGEESASVAELEQRTRERPQDGRARLALARRYQRLGQGERAQQAAQQALQAAQGQDEAVAATADFALRVEEVRARLRDEPRRQMAAHLSRYPRGPRAEQALAALSQLGPADAGARQALAAYLAAHQRAGEEDLVNQAVYACLRLGALAEAEAGARWLVQGAGAQRPAYLDTLAEVLHLRGERAEALRVSEQALALAPEPPAALRGKAAEAARALRVDLRKNQERYRRGQRELPDDLKREDESLQPWERPPSY